MLLVCDVRREPAVRQVVADFVEAYGGIDLLINSAGIGAGGRFEDFPVAHWRDVIDVNLLGVVHACHAALPFMLAAGSGQIVNVASAAAFHALPRVSAYNASKAGVLALTETLAAELDGTDVSVTVKMSTFYRSNLAKLTLGAREERVLTQRLMERSTLDVQTVADALLQGAGRRRLYVVLPRQAQVLWAFKRHLPRTYGAVLPRVAAKLGRRLRAQPPSDIEESL